MRLYSPAPLQSNQIKNQQIVEPGFAIASAEHKHIIADDWSGVELAHRSFTLYHRGDVQSKILYSFKE